MMEIPAQPERRVQADLPEPLVLPDLRVLLGPQALPDLWGQQVLRVRLVPPARQEIREPPEQQVLLGHLALQVRQDLPAPPAQRGLKEHMVIEAGQNISSAQRPPILILELVRFDSIMPPSPL